MIDRDRRLWMTAGGAAIAGVVAGVLPLPGGLDQTSATMTRLFAAIASIAIVLLVVLPGVVFRVVVGKRSVWIGVATLMLVLGVSAFLLHGAIERSCTAKYPGGVAVIGTELTPFGVRYAKTNPTLSNDELLFDAAGIADRVWTRASINTCRLRIGGTYFLWIPFLVACLAAFAQAAPSGTLLIGTLPAGAPRPGASATPAASVLRYDVFISYRHGGRDAEFARELLAALQQSGYTVAIDERDFPANASFLQEMERCIRESRFTTSIISARYLDSGNCEEEAIVCKVLDMNDRKRRLIPIVIEPVTMPAWLFGIVGVDCTKPDPLVDPFDKLRATIGPPLATTTP